MAPTITSINLAFVFLFLSLFFFLLDLILVLLYYNFDVIPPLIDPSARCPSHSTSSPFELQIFTPCATWSDLFLFGAEVCVTLSLFRLAVDAYSFKRRSRKDAERRAEDGGVELTHRTRRTAFDVEREAGVCTPPPAYNAATRTTSFVPLRTSTVEVPAYESPRVTVAPGASTDWLPGRVSDAGENQHDWRGKWNMRMARMDRGAATWRCCYG